MNLTIGSEVAAAALALVALVTVANPKIGRDMTPNLRWSRRRNGRRARIAQQSNQLEVVGLLAINRAEPRMLRLVFSEIGLFNHASGHFAERTSPNPVKP